MYKIILFSAAVATATIHMLLSKEKPAKCYTNAYLNMNTRRHSRCGYDMFVSICVCKHADFPVVCRFNVYDTRIHTVSKWRGHTHRAFTIQIKTGKSVEMEEKWFLGVSSIHASWMIHQHRYGICKQCFRFRLDGNDVSIWYVKGPIEGDMFKNPSWY